jgi:hypothetical protein
MLARRMIAAMLLVGLLAILTIAPASAATRTATFQVNLTVPLYGTQAIGTLTMTYDDVTGEGTWQFQGTIGGQLAQASGEGVCIIQSASGVRRLASLAQTEVLLRITTIETWNMPGFSPYVPREATVSAVGELAYVNYDGRSFDVFGVPIAFEPPLAFPVEGTYVVTDPASGQQPVETLPSTGVGPGDSSSMFGDIAPLLLPVAGGLLALASVVVFGKRPRAAAVVRC